MSTKGMVECFREVSWNTLRNAFFKLSETPNNTALMNFSIVLYGDMVKTDLKRVLNESTS